MPRPRVASERPFRYNTRLQPGDTTFLDDNDMDLFRDVTDSQAEAIRSTEGPLLVLAGAGSGKTRVVTYRIAHLVRGGRNPWNLLGITFTNKAAGEMQERVRALVEEDIWISTFHAFCARQLRRHLRHDRFTNDFTIFDEEDRRRLIRDILADLEVDPKQFQPAPVAQAVSARKNAAAGSGDPVRGFGAWREVVTEVQETYQERLARNNALDFDDLLLVLLEQLETRPELRQRLQDRFRYILVDEFQDTNRIQYRLLRLLTERHKNLCVTGDPDQSIYRWRGADLNNILDFERDYPGTKVVKLEQNWRSSKAILACASRLIAHNQRRKRKGLWTENPSGRPAALIEATDEEDEGLQVAGAVDDLLRAGYVPSDIAVFYRTNAQSRSLEKGLTVRRVPYVIVGSVAFFRRREVKDILAYLRLAVNFRDEVSFRRAVNMPPRGIGAKTLQAIRARADGAGCSLFEALERIAAEDPGNRAARRGAPFVRVVEAVREAGADSLRGAVETAVKASGYGEMLASSGDPKDRERLENLEELAGAAEEFEAKAGPRSDIRAFLEDVALVSDVDGWDQSAEAVSLMTLHAAKGLEFAAVFITGMEEGLLPHVRSQGSEDEIEEERRLCYVGITRAMDRLHLAFARRRKSGAARGDQDPSRFLREAGFDVAPTRALAPVFQDWGDWRYEPVPEGGGGSGSYCVGDRVEHPRFGRGKVLQITGFGETANLVVRFREAGTKTLRAGTAPLVKFDAG